MCQCDAMFQPTQRLENQLKLALAFIVIGIILAVLNFIAFIYSFGLNVLLCVLFLFLAYRTKFYVYMTIYILFSLYNSIQLFIIIGTYIQASLQYSDFSINYFNFSVALFTFTYYIFGVMFLFGVYKEMKAEFVENASGARSNGFGFNDERERQENQVSNNQVSNNRERNERNSDERDDNYRPPQQRGGFVAFGGRGTAVGGN